MSAGQSTRKQQILAAASDLFRRRGFHNVSVADITTAVDITASALYRHFRNKNDLLYSAVLSGVAPINEAGHCADSLHEVLVALAAASSDQQGLSLLWLREARYLSDEQRNELRGQISATPNRVSELISKQRPELSKSDCDLLAFSVTAVLSSTTLHTMNLPRRRREALLLSFTERVAHTPLPSPESPKQYMHEVLAIPTSRREQLLTAAIKLFDERGYQSVNLDAIGDAAGRTGPNMYNYFDSKIDLLVTAVTRGVDRRAFNAKQAMARATTPHDALRQLLDAQISFALEDSHLVGLMASELDELPEQSQRICAQEYRDFQDLWVRVLDHVRPGLDEAEAKATVTATLVLVANGARVGRLRRQPALTEGLSRIGMAVLLDTSDLGVILGESNTAV